MLSLPRLRARGQLTELRTEDLRFSADEAAAFLRNVMGLPLSAQQVSALEDRTEGWIAGLQMVALSIQGLGRGDEVSAFVADFSGIRQRRGESRAFPLSLCLLAAAQRAPRRRLSAILVTTADTDDRVVPMHAKKLAATLQAAGSANPVLLRVETKAGHGQGKPTSKAIEELADIFAFLVDGLNVEMA